MRISKRLSGKNIIQHVKTTIMKNITTNLKNDLANEQNQQQLVKETVIYK
jgi:hypothetical protein